MKIFNKLVQGLTLLTFVGICTAESCSNSSSSSSVCEQVALESVLEEQSFLQGVIQNGQSLNSFGGLYTLKVIISKVDNSGDVWYILKYWDKTKVGSMDPLEINAQHSIYELRTCTGQSIGYGPSANTVANNEGISLTTIDSKPFKY